MKPEIHFAFFLLGMDSHAGKLSSTVEQKWLFKAHWSGWQ
jgi:hypothetical protein